MKSAAFSLALAVCCLFGAEARANCALKVADTVQAHYDSVRDFSARFEQTSKSALFGASGGGLSVPVRGDVVFAKPGKMRWSYSEPAPSLVVSNGKTLWLYSPNEKSAQRLPVTEGYLTGAALEFLLGDGKLVDSFDVSSDVCPFHPVENEEGEQVPLETIELELTPKEPASYEKLGITARLTTGEVVATRVVDLFGNETRIAFEQIVSNRDPDPDTFVFVPDDDVEVIDLSPQP